MDLEAQLGEKIALVGGDDDDHCIGTGDTQMQNLQLTASCDRSFSVNIESRGSMFAHNGEEVKLHFKAEIVSRLQALKSMYPQCWYSVHGHDSRTLVSQDVGNDFADLDRDGSGSLDIQEVRYFPASSGESDSAMLMQIIDVNSDHSISEREYLAFTEVEKIDSILPGKSTFFDYDRNRDEAIDPHELFAFLQISSGVLAFKGQLMAILHDFDIDYSKDLNHEEFQNLLGNTGRSAISEYESRGKNSSSSRRGIRRNQN